MIVRPTIVTAYFDLQGRAVRTAGCERLAAARRTPSFYMRAAEPLLRWDTPLVVYTDPEFAEVIAHRRRELGFEDRTRVHCMTLEESPYYRRYARATREAFAAGRRPARYSPTKDTPLYLMCEWTKMECLRLVARQRPFGTANVAWVDFGIHHACRPPRDSRAFLRSLARLDAVHVGLFHGVTDEVRALAATDRAAWYSELRQYVPGGVLGGPAADVLSLADAFDVELERNVMPTFPSLDEAVLFALYAEHPEHFARPTLMASHADLLQSIEAREHPPAPRGGRSGMPKAATVCLCMMVKNESRVIRRALDSAAPHVDAWCITDTGSTDGTPALIERYFADWALPGSLHETSFVDFGTSRTEALAHAHAFCLAHGIDYLLLLDADEVIEIRDADWKQQLSGAPYLLLYDDALAYRAQYLVPAAPRWRFVGRTHEYMQAVDPCPPREHFDGIVLHDHGDGGAKADKFTRDLRLLVQTLAESPADERAWFYLGETYRNGGIDVAAALHAYTTRARLGGFEEEAWYAAYRRGSCREHLSGPTGDPWPALLAYLAAWERRPWRAEPLCDVVRVAAAHGMSLLGAVVGEYALAHVVARPERRQDILFIDRDKHGPLLWEWLSQCLYRAGWPRRAAELAQRARASATTADSHARIQHHLDACAAAPVFPALSIEALVDGCRRLREHGLHHTAMIVAVAAVDLLRRARAPIPWELDVERSISGYYVPPHREESRRLNATLIARRDVPDQARSALRRHRRFAASPIAPRLLRSAPLRFEPGAIPPGYHAMNPSLCALGGRLVVNVRAVNYTIRADGAYQFDGFVRTRNLLGVLGDDDTVRGLRELTALDVPGTEEAVVCGFEDCRLVTLDGASGARLLAVANHACPGDSRRRAQFLLEIASPFGNTPEVVRALHLHGYEDRRDQKNWMPVSVGEELRLVYSCDPTIVLRPDLATGLCDVVSRTEPAFWCADVRGGSQLVEFTTPDARRGFLAFVHGVLGESPRSYFHALLRFDEHLALERMSAPFVLRDPTTIEFVAGCALDGDDLVLTWGQDDASAWVGRMTLADALRLCDGDDPAR